MNRFLICLALTLSCCAVCRAQLRTWDNLSGGLWSAPANWSGGDTPDTPAESAVFDRFGSFPVTLPAATSIDDFRVDRGTVRLISAGASPAELSPAGDIVVGGELTLSTDPIGGGVSLLGSGELTVTPGGELLVEESTVTAGSTRLGGDSLAGGSRILATGVSTLDLGELRVGVSGGTTDRVAVDLFDGSALTVDDLRIGADAAGVFAEVTLPGAVLTQPASAITRVGRSLGPTEAGRGSLAVSDGGSASLGSLVIDESGRVVTVGGQITVANDVTIHAGGSYSTRLEPGSSAAPALTAGSVTLGGELHVELAPQASRDFEEGDIFRVLQAETITGAFDTLSTPDLPAGLQWRVRQSRRGLSLVVTPIAATGDFNFDGSINAADYAVWRDTLGQQGPAHVADANNDGFVDELDYEAWRQAFIGSAAPATGVPEPGSLALLALVAAIHAASQVARPSQLS